MKTNWQHQKQAITTDQKNLQHDELTTEHEKQKLHSDAESERATKRELKKKHSTESSNDDQADGG